MLSCIGIYCHIRTHQYYCLELDNQYYWKFSTEFWDMISFWLLSKPYCYSSWWFGVAEGVLDEAVLWTSQEQRGVLKPPEHSLATPLCIHTCTYTYTTYHTCTCTCTPPPNTHIHTQVIHAHASMHTCTKTQHTWHTHTTYSAHTHIYTQASQILYLQAQFCSDTVQKM